MKIPLVIENSDKITLTVLFRCPKKNIMLTVKFTVDTGSPFSFVGKDDVAKNDRLLQNLPIKDQALMGGVSINIAELNGPVIISFKDENSSFQEITLPKFAVSDKTSQKGYSVSPSIIGLDFLREHGFTLFVDMKNNIAYLEKQ